jgi:hypothetical protein
MYSKVGSVYDVYHDRRTPRPLGISTAKLWRSQTSGVLDLETKAATVAQNCVTRDTASTISNWQLLDNETRRKAAMGGFPLKKKNEIDGLTKHRDQHASVLRHFTGPARGNFFREDLEARLPRLEVLFSRNKMLVFSIRDSLSRLFFAVSTDVEFDSCGICVVSPHSRSVHLSVYFGVYFLKEKKLNQTI